MEPKTAADVDQNRRSCRPGYRELNQRKCGCNNKGEEGGNTKTRKHKHTLKLKELVCVLILARIRKIRPAAAGRAC